MAMTGGQAGSVDLQQRDVRARIAAGQPGFELTLIGQADDDLVALLDHVVIGDHVAVRGDDEAGAEAGPRLRRGAFEETPEELLARRRAAPLRGADVHHGRGDAAGDLDPDAQPRGQGAVGARLAPERLRVGAAGRADGHVDLEDAAHDETGHDHQGQDDENREATHGVSSWAHHTPGCAAATAGGKSTPRSLPEPPTREGETHATTRSARVRGHRGPAYPGGA
jgi:hypothetical protein